MKKKENEFTKSLDKLELELQIRNQKKAIETRRLKKVETILDQKNEAKEKFLKEEAEVAKTGEVKDRMGTIVSGAVVAVLIIVPYYKKDPVNFWFYVIVGLCYLSFYVMKKYSK